MNRRAEMLSARSGLGGFGIKHQLATRRTPEKHSHCIRTLVGKMSCCVTIDFCLIMVETVDGVCSCLSESQSHFASCKVSSASKVSHLAGAVYFA